MMRIRWIQRALLALIPCAIGLKWLAPEQQVAIFVVAGLAIIPLAGYIGSATDTLASRLGAGIGGLLNATFGNAAELIISGVALRHGLTSLVKASITGSIISNVLLVFGAAAVAGGLRRPIVHFNRTAAGLGTSMLVLSAIALVVPALFHHLSRNEPDAPELRLDTEIAVVLLVTYGLYLLFSLRTHRGLYTGGVEADSDQRRASTSAAVFQLAGATAGVAVVSEILVDALTPAARDLGASQLFVGVIVLAIIGNAAEHYSAVTLAWQNKMDAALQIAVGSSTQIALFVAPVLLLLSFVIAPQPMDLLFTTFELTAMGLSVLIITFVAHDGETHWMEGVQLLAVYVILALGFFFLPAR
jgi:Ca2+:H+ antiporter